jgi:hypothetical protein
VLTLPKHFDLLLSSIEPEDARAESAALLPWQVRDYLKDCELITTVAPHSRLAGSYARHTATKKIKDVDIILLVSEAYRDEDPEVVLDALYSALGGLAEALGDTGEIVVRRHQRRFIQVHLDQHDFNMDVVPAVAFNGIDMPLEIPDKDWSKWVKTDPLGYADCLSALNAGHGDKVVPLIKLWKHWRDVQMVYRRPKSYWLECMVYHQVNGGAIVTDGRSYADMFRDLLATLCDEYAPFLEEDDKVPEVKDPMLGNNVAHNWERPAFETFMRRLDESRRYAAKALEAETTDDAVKQWQNVFGEEWFPDAAAVAREQGKALRAAGIAGTLFVTSKGHISTAQPQGQSYVQPPVQRFYGKG